MAFTSVDFSDQGRAFHEQEMIKLAQPYTCSASRRAFSMPYEQQYFPARLAGTSQIITTLRILPSRLRLICDFLWRRPLMGNMRNIFALTPPPLYFTSERAARLQSDMTFCDDKQADIIGHSRISITYRRMSILDVALCKLFSKWPSAVDYTRH